VSTTVPIDVSLDGLDEVSESGRTGLYRLYNAADEVIYIGISDDPVARMKQHAADKDWWPEVTRKTLVWYSSRTAAETAETIAIGLEQPKHNKAKRYVRLDEQPFPEPGSRLVRRMPRVQPKPSADAGPATNLRQEPERTTPLDRYNPMWGACWHSGFPHEWPASLWCIDWYYAQTPHEVGLCYEDFMRVHDGGVGPWEPQDFLRERAQARREKWAYITWWQRGPQGTWIAGFDATGADQANPLEISDVAWEQQRRFLYALLRADRCTSVQVGRRAWAVGIRDEQEARVTNSILASIAHGPGSAALATACLEARYREPTLRRNGYRWFSYQCEACSPYSSAIDDPTSSAPLCSCPSNCGDRYCRADYRQRTHYYSVKESP
jgi:predicted GIY-YIG superfamily endonuclease